MAHLPGVGLEDQLTCRMMAAFCQEILVHSFLKQWKPNVSSSGSEENNGGLENLKTEGHEFNKVDETEDDSILPTITSCLLVEDEPLVAGRVVHYNFCQSSSYHPTTTTSVHLPLLLW